VIIIEEDAPRFSIWRNKLCTLYNHRLEEHLQQYLEQQPSRKSDSYLASYCHGHRPDQNVGQWRSTTLKMPHRRFSTLSPNQEIVLAVGWDTSLVEQRCGLSRRYVLQSSCATNVSSSIMMHRSPRRCKNGETSSPCVYDARDDNTQRALRGGPSEW